MFYFRQFELRFPTTFEPFDVQIPHWQAFQSLAGLLKSEKSSPETLSWAEAHPDVAAAWLPGGENQSKWFTWWSLSALPQGSSSRPPSWPLSPQRLGNQEGSLRLQHGLYIAGCSPPQELYWQPFFDCVTHSWRSVQPGDKSLTARSFFSRGLWGEWSRQCDKASLLSELLRGGEAGREDKEPT